MIAWPSSAGKSATPATYRQPSRLLTLSGQTMGTTWSVRLPADTPTTPGLQTTLQHTLDAYVAQVSHWRDDSLLSRFNRAPAGSRHRLPAEFSAVIGAALAIARATGGAFDPSLGTLVDLWGFGAGDRLARPPDDARVAQIVATLRATGGWQRLPFDAARRELTQPGGMRLDLSGIAKGHAVDLLSARLCALDLVDHLVEIGGELRANGKRPGGQPWRVAVQGPGDDAPPTGIAITLDACAVATSGDYLRYFDHAGQRYAHTLDPGTGQPIDRRLASVTVVADDCLHADAFATALGVMGADQGFDYARDHALAALFLVRDPIDPRHPLREVIRVKPTPDFIAISDHDA